MKLKNILPASFRQRLRVGFDRFFQRRDLNLIKLGDACSWTVMPDGLRPGAMVLSGGAGHDISFEVELAKRFGCRVAVFDPSPTGRQTFSEVAEPPAGLTFHLLGLSGENRTVSFACPADSAEGSFGVASQGVATVEFECVSPREALCRAGLTEIELLKIDIEGFEYEFLEKMLEQGIRPAQIAVEFHHFLPNISFGRTFATMRRLWAAGYVIAHKQQCDLLFVHRRTLD